MRSTRFCVNCYVAFLRRILPPGRAIWYCTIPFVEQQEHLAQRAEVCGIEVFSPCGPLHVFGQREVKGLRGARHFFLSSRRLNDSANCLKKSWGRSNTTRRKTSPRGEAVLLRTPSWFERGFMFALRS